MFDFLKKKIGGFVDKLTKTEEEKTEKKEPKPKEKKIEAPKKVEKPKKKEKPKIEKKPEPVKAVKKKEPEKKKPAPKIVEKPPAKEKKVEKPTQVIPEKEKIEKPKKTEEETIQPEQEIIEEPKEIIQTEEEIARPEEIEEDVPQVEEKIVEGEIPEPDEVEVPEPEETEKEIEEPAEIAEPEIEETKEIEEPKEKPKERIKVGALGAIKSFITREVEINSNDVENLLEEFELELLEADVELSVAEAIRTELSEKLIGSKIKKDELHEFINQTMKETLIDMLENENIFDILERVKSSSEPVKIVFLGINGAGKTTTIAKVAKLLLDNDQKIVFAAADTFRAAAIEQMQVHADRLNVKMIKREYGSDPTSVAYDAANYAKAHGIDAVLIDTAGRQDTNISLINEMKKMTRVIEPDLTIYIGESIAGNAIIEQISSFNKEIGIDRVILTKLDCDPKGGTMLSINRATGIPIIYVGIGQSYDDLEPFDAKKIIERIV